MLSSCCRAGKEESEEIRLDDDGDISNVKSGRGSSRAPEHHDVSAAGTTCPPDDGTFESLASSPSGRGNELDPETVAADPVLENLPTDAREALLRAEQKRRGCRPFEAESIVHELVQQLQREGRQDVFEAVTTTLAYREIVAEMEEINRILKKLLDDEGWTYQKASEGIHVWTRFESGSDLVTVRMAGCVDGPFDHFCSVGKEVQLVKTWMPGVKTSYILKKLNDFDQIGYYFWKFPFFAGREFLVEEHAMINDNDGYCVVTRCPPVPREGLTIPPVPKNQIRAAISNWCSYTAPIGQTKKGQKCSFAVTVMNVDLQIPLPTKLINYLSVAMGFNTFQQLRQNVRKSQEPSHPLFKSLTNPENMAYYCRMRDLEVARETRPLPCLSELLETGWVKDPLQRRTLFNRSSGVLVPLE